LQKGEKVKIGEITDQFVELNTGETAQPQRTAVEVYRELQTVQDEISSSLRDVFSKHRQFALRTT